MQAGSAQPGLWVLPGIDSTKAYLRSVARQTQLVEVRTEGWVGIYKDGELLAEDENLSPKQILEVLGYEFRSVDADPQWLDQIGSLPESVSEIELAEI